MIFLLLLPQQYLEVLQDPFCGPGLGNGVTQKIRDNAIWLIKQLAKKTVICGLIERASYITKHKQISDSTVSITAVQCKVGEYNIPREASSFKNSVMRPKFSAGHRQRAILENYDNVRKIHFFCGFG